jgi:hypothetical protein
MDAESLSRFARKHLITVALSLVGAIFAVCLSSAIGWTLGGLYILPVALVALWSSSRHRFPILVTATLATAALTVSFFVSPHWANKLVALTCYIVPLVTIWSIALLSVSRKWVQQHAQAARTISVCASCRKLQGEHGWSLEAYLQKPPGTLLRLDLCPNCAPKFGVDFDGKGVAEQIVADPLGSSNAPRAKRIRTGA